MAVSLGNRALYKQDAVSGSNVDTEAMEQGNSQIVQVPSVMESEVAAQNNMMQAKNQYELEIRKSGLIDQLTAEIVMDRPETITQFGSKAAEPLSKVADQILGGYTLESVTKSGNMLNILTNLMKQVDLEEIQKDPQEPKGLFAKFQKSVEDKVNSLLAKYQNIGGEMEKVCVELKTINKEIGVSNTELEKMYDVNLQYYKQLVAYIIAGQQALGEISEYYTNTENEVTTGGDPEAQMQLQTISYARDLMEKKVLDLKTAESVALQAIPIIQSMIYGNLNLSTEIENSFITVLPNFKTAIVLAVNNKKQYLQAKALSGVREMASELVVKNAENAVAQMKRTVTMSGTAAIDVDKIEKSWDILMNGIKETNELKDQLHVKRQTDIEKLTNLNNKYLNQLHSGLSK